MKEEGILYLCAIGGLVVILLTAIARIDADRAIACYEAAKVNTNITRKDKK